MNKAFIFLFICSLFLNCKKRSEPISWNADYIIPVSSDSINIGKILGSQKLTLSNNGTHAIFNDTLKIFTFDQEDFLPELDFSLTDTIDIPPIVYGFPFPPGFEIPQFYTKNEEFNFEDLKLSEINFNSLKIKYSIKSNIDGILYFNLTVPTATNNLGEEYNDTLTIPSTNGQIEVFEGEVPLDDYIFDLSNNDSTFNNIQTSLKIGYSSENNDNIILSSNDFLSITLSLIDLNINTISGYLGNMEINDSNEISLPFMEKLSSDNISVENPEIQLIINNGLGLDAQIVLEEIAFKKNQNTTFLEHPIIDQSINISRALDLGWNFQYGKNTVDFNNQNSNIEELIGKFPEKINLKYHIESNPLGNHSGFNDFYNSNHALDVDVGIKIPIKFNLNNLRYTDTITVTIPENIHPKSAKIYMDIENELPLNCCIYMTILNGDSLNISPRCITSANLLNSGNLSESENSSIEIQVNNKAMNQLINEKKIILDLVLNSPDTTINFPISENQNFIYKMGVELNTNISIE